MTRRMPRLPVPLIGYTAGCACSVVGIYLLWGLGLALLIGGAVVAASFVLAYAGDKG